MGNNLEITHSRKSIFFRKRKGLLIMTLSIILLILVYCGELNDTLHAAYQKEISTQIVDKNGKLLQRVPNQKDHYMTEGGGAPRLRELAILKEDKYYYYHLGINPVSSIRGLTKSLLFGQHIGGSTITQQLVKNLLRHENDRTISNKLTELIYATALELYTSKEDILTMYLSSAYFGKQIEGIEGASEYYFGKKTSELADGEMVRLLVLLSSPSYEPSSVGNTVRATNLKGRLGIDEIAPYIKVPSEIKEIKKDPAMFEVTPLMSLLNCGQTCALTIDQELTTKIRGLVNNQLNTKPFASVGSAAVAVIKLGKNGGSNKLLALIGTPDPYGNADGAQINMALAPRPIGSTWKPFIYAKAIEASARPYSIINDMEYRYEIGTGYAFYPKNYDGIYRGDVTLHYALANSLNVPAVRALQFYGIDAFGRFMQDSLGFIPKQSFDTYQFSVALGGLEMNPLLLANYFTIFPQHGVLLPLELISGRPMEIPMLHTVAAPKRILSPTTTEIINKMLSDRLIGIEQFGLTSNLNLPFLEYAVKTGTSYDYHDSWTVGYTPEIVVVVWIGNSNNKPMDLLSGARGAGKIWHDVMSLLEARGDITPQPFEVSTLVDVETKEGRSFGLPNDDTLYSRTVISNMLDGSQAIGTNLILEPHNKDVLLYQKGMSVPLRAERTLVWRLDGRDLGVGERIFWSPETPGEFRIDAYESNGKHAGAIQIYIVE